MYVKEYTVDELSELLMVNKETVRRWIRDGKLNGARNSKKEGYTVDEFSLQLFLIDNPKYNRICALKDVPKHSDDDATETKRKIYSAGKILMEIKDLMAELECMLSELHSM
jgi:hypothetical protein